MMMMRTSQRFFNIIDIGHFLTNQCRHDRILVEFIESLPSGCCVLQPAASFCAFFYQICRLFPPDVQKLIWLASHGKMLRKHRYFRPKNVTKWRNFSLISSLLSGSKRALPGGVARRSTFFHEKSAMHSARRSWECYRTIAAQQCGNCYAYTLRTRSVSTSSMTCSICPRRSRTASMICSLTSSGFAEPEMSN